MRWRYDNGEKRVGGEIEGEVFATLTWLCAVESAGLIEIYFEKCGMHTVEEICDDENLAEMTKNELQARCRLVGVWVKTF